MLTVCASPEYAQAASCFYIKYVHGCNCSTSGKSETLNTGLKGANRANKDAREFNFKILFVLLK